MSATTWREPTAEQKAKVSSAAQSRRVSVTLFERLDQAVLNLDLVPINLSLSLSHFKHKSVGFLTLSHQKNTYYGGKEANSGKIIY